MQVIFVKNNCMGNEYQKSLVLHLDELDLNLNRNSVKSIVVTKAKLYLRSDKALTETVYLNFKEIDSYRYSNDRMLNCNIARMSTSLTESTKLACYTYIEIHRDINIYCDINNTLTLSVVDANNQPLIVQPGSYVIAVITL